MQEEVNQKTVAVSIRTTKLTGKEQAAVLGKVARALHKHHRKALTPQGRQSVKKLMNHYGGDVYKRQLLYCVPLPTGSGVTVKPIDAQNGFGGTSI